MKKILNEQMAVSDSNPIRVRRFDYVRFTYPWHYHSQYELLFVERGKGTCLVGDSVTDYGDNDLLFFGTGLPHCMQTEPGNGQIPPGRAIGVNIQLEKDFMHYSFSHYTQFAQIRGLLEESSRGIRFPLGKNPEIVQTLNLIPQSKGVEQIIHIIALLQALAVFRRKVFAASPSYNPEPSLYADKKVEKITAYLGRHYARHISLAEAASYAAMNEAAFCRYFKEKTGKTLTQYITELRIGYACKLLAASAMNISQVCLECGFESVAHFNRCFKRITGLSPTAYKESLLSNLRELE